LRVRHSVTRVLPYQPRQLFEMVGDVESYPQFVPWITGMRVWNRRDDEAGGGSLDAEAAVQFAVLKERFSTRVRRDAAAGEITVSLISGPFQHLVNRWRFRDDPEGTRVDFQIDFEFKSKTLTKLLSANFHHAVERLMQCFEGRARELYGARGGGA